MSSNRLLSTRADYRSRSREACGFLQEAVVDSLSQYIRQVDAYVILLARRKRLPHLYLLVPL